MGLIPPCCRCIQVANLYGKGADKLPFDGRVEFARNHLPEIFEAADNPFGGSGYPHPPHIYLHLQCLIGQHVSFPLSVCILVAR